MRAFGTLTVSGKIENGARMTKRTVYLSTASTRSIGPTSPRYGEAVFGSSKVVNVATTSSATSSRPLWNLTPWRSLKVQRRAPSAAVHESARSGTTSRLMLSRVRLLYIHRVAVHSAPLMCMIGLMVLRPNVTLTRRRPPYFSPWAKAGRDWSAGTTTVAAAALEVCRNARRDNRVVAMVSRSSVENAGTARHPHPVPLPQPGRVNARSPRPEGQRVRVRGLRFLQAHVLVWRGEIQERIQADRRFLDPRPDAVQRGRLEDRAVHHALVHQLLDLEEERLALLPIPLLRLLAEEVVDVGIPAIRVG